MGRESTKYIPPVGFYFRVEIMGKNGRPGPPADQGFQEVSGISMSMETETIVEGGENRFSHTVPVRAKFEDLVLKRGVLVRSSPLASWVFQTLGDGLNAKIKPRTIKVSLLDANNHVRDPLLSWVFENAYPTKWSISNLDASKSEIVVENITFSYSYFRTEVEEAAKKYPQK